MTFSDHGGAGEPQPTRRRPPRERGASATEYALLLAAFVVALIAAVEFVQASSSERLDEVDVTRHDAQVQIVGFR
jgi:Flp pilus assembly pilin Flp